MVIASLNISFGRYIVLLRQNCFKGRDLPVPVSVPLIGSSSELLLRARAPGAPHLLPPLERDAEPLVNEVTSKRPRKWPRYSLLHSL